MNKHSCPVIGHIRTPFANKKGCPIQSIYSENAQGRIEILPEYAPALQDVEGFTHIYLLYQMDRAGEIKLIRPTFLDENPHGLFASRHPCRPSAIGLSIVRLTGVDGDVLTVEGVDMLDNTPLLDIKPYLPQYDCFPEAGKGWTEGKSFREKPEGRE
jgi:tRNA (adenine37-N6)-methyltransferase